VASPRLVGTGAILAAAAAASASASAWRIGPNGLLVCIAAHQRWPRFRSKRTALHGGRPLQCNAPAAVGWVVPAALLAWVLMRLFAH
jgi:hypothetical protein